MPPVVKLWLMLLMAVNLVIALFFIKQFEAQIILAIFMINAILMVVITAKYGLTRILGLGHFLWIPLIIYLWIRLPEISAQTPYGIWIRAVIIINLISVIIDIVDVVKYLNGDRKEMVEIS